MRGSVDLVVTVGYLVLGLVLLVSLVFAVRAGQLDWAAAATLALTGGITLGTLALASVRMAHGARIEVVLSEPGFAGSGRRWSASQTLVLLVISGVSFAIFVAHGLDAMGAPEGSAASPPVDASTASEPPNESQLDEPSP